MKAVVGKHNPLVVGSNPTEGIYLSFQVLRGKGLEKGRKVVCPHSGLTGRKQAPETARLRSLFLLILTAKRLIIPEEKCSDLLV